ncbi:MAG TPA: ATP-binding cassette domain-containing protein, partial [Solirubrobacteraceae bacterium]|nr:ATP-binding cassette domain-containing protein [Solirubrobacteraceae bacterium]
MLRVEARTRLGALGLDVALEVDPGACLALAGPSGAGKTSILRVAAGLLRPEHGAVSCGEEVWLDTARGIDVAPERRGCGYVFQEYALFGHLRAWQNVAYPLTGLS